MATQYHLVIVLEHVEFQEGFTDAAISIFKEDPSLYSIQLRIGFWIVTNFPDYFIMFSLKEVRN